MAHNRDFGHARLDSTTVKIDGAVVRQDDFGSLFTGISMSLGPGVLFDSLVVIPSGSVTPLQSTGAANDLSVSVREGLRRGRSGT